MYARTCTLLLSYPTQTPLLFSGSRLDRQCFLRFICAHGVAGGLGGGSPPKEKQEAQLMLTTGSTRLAVSRGQQTWYHSTCNI